MARLVVTPRSPAAPDELTFVFRPEIVSDDLLKLPNVRKVTRGSEAVRLVWKTR